MDKNRGNRNQGRSKRDEKDSEFNEQVITIDRVVRVVKGGRRFRFRVLVVVGNGKGKVGVGVSKGGDIQNAITKAVADAKKSMFDIAIENGTIPHEIIGRQSASRVLLKPAADGTGLIAGGTVRMVLEAAGVKNVLSKSLGSSTKLNVAHATLNGLKDLKPRKDWIGAEKNAPAPKKAESVEAK